MFKAPPNNNRNLLFSSIGDNSQIEMWLHNYNLHISPNPLPPVCPEDPNFDTMFYYYGDVKPPSIPNISTVIKKGLKFENFIHFWDTHALGKKYDNYFILDDDIQIYKINEIFDIFNYYKLQAAQPAFTPDSDIHFQITSMDQNCILRYCDYIEEGAIILTLDMIEKSIQLFRNSPSGWGVGDMLHSLLEYSENQMAIIDSIPCRHPFRSKSLMNKHKNLLEGTTSINQYLSVNATNQLATRRIFGKINKNSSTYDLNSKPSFCLRPRILY